MTAPFAVTWDYRCPFARNAHDHLVAGLRAGAEWDVRFVAFNLDSTHLEEGDAPVWEEPDRYPGLLANEVGIVVRDRQPESFLAVHDALFRARHEDARDTRETKVLVDVLTETGVDPGSVFAEIEDGWPLETFRKEHESAVAEHQVFGVPTFIVQDRAVFVRLLSRPAGDGALAVATIERIVDLIDGAPEINEFKYTSIPR